MIDAALHTKRERGVGTSGTLDLDHTADMNSAGKKTIAPISPPTPDHVTSHAADAPPTRRPNHHATSSAATAPTATSLKNRPCQVTRITSRHVPPRGIPGSEQGQ